MDEIQTPIKSPDVISDQPVIPTTPAKSPLGLIVKIVVGVLVVAVVGIGVVLATRVWNPVWNPFKSSSEKVIERMFVKMGEIKTAHSEMDVNVEFTGEETGVVSVVFSGDSDNTEPENPKSTADFDISIAGEGMQFSLAGKLKTVEKVSYLKMTTLPALPMLAMLGIDLSTIKDQWIKFDQESLLKTMTGGTYMPGMEKIMQEQKEKQEEIIKQLEVLFKSTRFYCLKKELPDEKIDGRKMHHYLLALDKEEIKQVGPELYEILSSYSLDAYDTSFNKEEFEKSIDELFDKVGEITFEIWIGKKDNLLYRIKIEKEIDTSKTEEGTQGKVTIRFNLELSNFDKPVTIETPENFVEMKDIMQPLMQLFLPQTPGIYPGTYPQAPGGYPSGQPFMQGNSSLFQASLFGILSNLLR